MRARRILTMFLLVFAAAANAATMARVYAIEGPRLECYEDFTCREQLAAIISAHPDPDRPHLLGQTFTLRPPAEVYAEPIPYGYLYCATLRKGADAICYSEAR